MSSTPEQLDRTAARLDPEEATAAPGPGEDLAVEDLVLEDLVVEDLLVEDISIDGMCGVY